MSMSIFVDGPLVNTAFMGIALLKAIGGATGSFSNPNGVLSNFTQQQTFLWIRMTPKNIFSAHNFVGWVKIPKRHQVFNEGDSLVLNTSISYTIGETWSQCANFVYKWR